MAIATTEVLVVETMNTPLDLLLWRRFKREVPGLVEATLALEANYGLAALGKFPPVGTKVTVNVPAPQPKSRRRVVSLFD